MGSSSDEEAKDLDDLEEDDGEDEAQFVRATDEEKPENLVTSLVTGDIYLLGGSHYL